MGIPTSPYKYPYRNNDPTARNNANQPVTPPTATEQKANAAALEKFQSVGRDPFKEAALRFHSKGYGSTGTSNPTTYVDPLPAPAANAQPKRAPVGHGHSKK